MGIRIRQVAFWVALAVLAASCTQGHCRRKKDTPIAAPTGEAPPEPGTKALVNNDAGRVMVFKYDGSLQCGGGKAMSPEAMAKEMRGVKIYSMAKKPDGLMHIQVCGSITGMANVYEIDINDLKKAEAKGFKKWSFE